MIQLYVLLHTLIGAARSRRDDRGAVSLEQVIITLGLFAVATAVVVGITAFVNNKLGGLGN
ncbi:MAG: hypothetical protein DLM59_20010 [Pseudonocardiales bacterium]|nr:MAG: hypothetical protein DLM59_20010 [Pseudonocardiales bacterium]